MKTSGISEIAAKAANGELLPEGWYQLKLLDIDERLSKARNSMMVPRWGIRHGETDVELTDHLTDARRNSLRLRHLCASFGGDVLAKYEAGSLLATDFALGTVVMAHIIIEPAHRPYPAKNAIEDYSAVTVSAVVTPLRAAG